MNKWVKVIFWIVFGAWLIFLTILSSEDGFSTSQTSGKFTVFFMVLFHIPKVYHDRVEMILRISAHFVGFFVLGWLLYSAMRFTWAKSERIHLWAWGFCGILGIMDEVKKVFIAGRHLSWEEAGLNIIGAWCGIIIVMIVIEQWYCISRS